MNNMLQGSVFATKALGVDVALHIKELHFKAKRKNVKVTKEELKELAKLEDNQ